MRHLEPEQLAQRTQGAKPRGARSLWPAAAAIVALSFAGGYGATLLAPPIQADNVSSTEIKSRADDFARAPRLKLTTVAAERTGSALLQMGLSAKESDALAAQISMPPAVPSQEPQVQPQPSPRRLSLVELVLWDTHAPDGDVVLVTSAGYSREVLLTKTPSVIHVPGTGAGTILITGLRDGGGGITLGVKGESVALSMPIMSVGQTLALPVQFP